MNGSWKRRLRKLLRRPLAPVAPSTATPSVTPPEEHAKADLAVQRLRRDLPRSERIVKQYREMGESLRQ